MMRLAKRQLKGGRGWGPVVEGQALVSCQGFNARYDLDRVSGAFSRPDHDHCGASPAGKIFIFTAPKGGIATSWALLDLQKRGLAPMGLVCRRSNPVVVQGAVLAGLPLIDSLPEDPTQCIQTGDWIRLVPHAGGIEVLS
jgi:predicted aconitase with swiveling domain